MPILNQQNSFSNTVAMAQEYNNYDDNKSSQYPTKENKYECKTGPFEGFFVSSVEFCKHVKFDDRKDHRDDKTGIQGPQGPIGLQGAQGVQGPPGINGTNGVNGTNGINGTNATGFTCVACLLDALAKLETGAVVVNVTATIPTGDRPPLPPTVSLSLPLTIDLDTAALLQVQLAASLGLDANATIFEICAAIDAGTTLDINAILAALDLTIDPLIRAEITGQITNVAQVLNATGIIVPAPLLTLILTGINFATIVDEISIDIRASLGILEACLGLPPTSPPPPAVNNVYVTWRDNTPGNYDTFFAVSNNNGQTFGTPINLSNNTGTSEAQQIATIGNNVYVTWQDNTPGNFDIFFAASTDNGQTFTNPPLNLSNSTGDSLNPQIAAVGNNVYVTWTGEPSGGGNFDIFFAASTDNGQTFTNPPLNLSNNTGVSFNPQIAAVGNNVYVTWADTTSGNFEIAFAASTDNGQIFTNPPLNLSNSTGDSNSPELAAIGNNVYVTWRDNTSGNFEIAFAASTDNGQTFTNPPLNLSNTLDESSNPQIAAVGNNVYVTWQDGTLSNADIFFAASTDNGQIFTNPPLNLSNNTGLSFAPQITAIADNVYITWRDNAPGNADIFFAASTDNGQIFTNPPLNLSNSTGESDRPRITIFGNNVYVTWDDNTLGNLEIAFAASTDNGQIFTNPPLNLSNNPGDSVEPQIAATTLG